MEESCFSDESRSDEEIVRLVPRDKDFFAVLIRRYEKRLTGYVRRLNGQGEEAAQDLVQNIFLKAYVYLNSFRQGEKFSNWLFGIAHNECIDYWRRNKKHQSVLSLEASEELVRTLRSDDDPAKEIERHWDAASLREALDRLPLKYREVLVLRFLEDRSYEDIAFILKKPVSTVGTLVRRAKQQLGELMQKHDS